MNRDSIAFLLVLAGALCAECIPLSAALIGAAWVVKFARTGERTVPGGEDTGGGQAVCPTGQGALRHHTNTCEEDNEGVS